MVGTIAACLISGPLTDWSARWLSVRNHGEFRLFCARDERSGFALQNALG